MKIIAVGKNYAKHAKEMNSDVPTEPVIFLKPETALLKNNKPLYYPDFTKLLHYETELIFRICKIGKNIDKKFAHRYYDKIGIGIDFTARDIQYRQKEKGLPWELAKGFDNSAPISEFIDISEFKDINNINFSLDINGKTVQTGNSSDMIFKIDEVISFVSKFFTLKIGDIIFTGTPQGVGEVKIGDKLTAKIENKELLTCEIK